MTRRIAVLVVLAALTGCGQKPLPTPPTPPTPPAVVFAPVPAFVPANPVVAPAPADAAKPLLVIGDTRSGGLPAPKVTPPASYCPYTLIFRPSADGKRLVTSQRNSDDRSVRVWDTTTGRLIDQLTPEKKWYEGWWSDGISSISPTARWIASGESPTHELTVWDTSAGKPALRVKHPNPPDRKDTSDIRSLFEPVGFPTENELWVLDRPAAEFRLLEVPSGKVLRTLAGFKDVWHVCLSSDGKRLAASGWEGVAVRSTDPDTKWETLHPFKQGDKWSWEAEWCGNGKAFLPCPPDIGFSPTGVLVTSRFGRVQLPKDAELPPRALPAWVDVRGPHEVGFGVKYYSADGRRRYNPPERSEDRMQGVVVTEVATGRVLARLPMQCTGGVAVSPDGTRLYTSNPDGTVSVWDLPALEAKHLPNAEIKDHWAALASPDPAVGHSAVRQLATDPKAVVWLQECFAEPRESPLAKLIAELGHADYRTREAATKTLGELGSVAHPDLRRVVAEGPSEEAVERAERVLADHGRRPYQEWAGLSLDQVREVRAVEVLERVGGAAAVRVLTEWAKGDSPVRKTEASAALVRLQRK